MTEETSARIGWPERRAAMRRFARAAATFDGCDAVHTEARNRLLERLGLLGLNPRRVLDLGSATGKATARLAERYPDAQIVAVDLCGPMAERTRTRCRGLRSAMPVVGDAQRLPLGTDSMDLVFANLVLPWCDPRAVFAELARVLREGGLALFSSVGPDTLCEVRRAWAQVDGFVHVHGFVDMHDLGDLMARAGLAEPVVDVDRLRVTYRALPRPGERPERVRREQRRLRSARRPHRARPLAGVRRPARGAARRRRAADERGADIRAGLGGWRRRTRGARHRHDRRRGACPGTAPGEVTGRFCYNFPAASAPCLA